MEEGGGGRGVVGGGRWAEGGGKIGFRVSKQPQ